jgi:hypothetical protein
VTAVRRLLVAVVPAVLAACAAPSERGTLAELHRMPADVAEVPVDEGLEKAMQGYRQYLEKTPRTEMTPEAMRRLADLQIEKEFGIHGDGGLVEMADGVGPGLRAACGPRPAAGAGRRDGGRVDRVR